MKSSFKLKTKLGVVHLPIIIAALLAIITIPVIFIVIKKSSNELKFSVSAATNIDITTQAVQKVYQNGVPHFDINGNLRTTYDRNLSFFPNGIFWTTNEPKDRGAIPAVANAGFNLASTKRGADPKFYLDQINNILEYTVVISSKSSELQIVALATTNNTNITITDTNLLPGTTYLYLICLPNCGDGSLVTHGDVVAQTSGGQGSVNVSWESGANVKLIVDNSLTKDSQGNYQANTFSETLFQNYKNNSNVFGWWIADEPLNVASVSGKDPSINYNAVTQVYNDHKDQTNQSLFITESFPKTVDDTWKQFVSIGDLGNVYHYPKSFTTTGNINSLEDTANAAKELTLALNQSKPALFTPQFLNGWPGLQYLNPQEAKAQIYTALIHGTTGLLGFVWDSCSIRYSPDDIEIAGIRTHVNEQYLDCHQDAKALSKNEAAQANDLWNALDARQNGINKEIKELTPVLLSPTLRTPYTVQVDQTPISSAPIRTILKAYNGNYYLITVNINNAQINASFTFPFKIQGPVEKLYEGSQATLSGSSITDSFSPFAVHVYRFTTGIDADLDSFKDNVENAIGTDLNSNCATTSQTDAFPPDIDRNGVVTLQDILAVSRAFGKSSTLPDWPTYKRYDMDANGAITLTDIFLASKFYGKAFCP